MGLMDQSASYGDLVRKYGQFHTPACLLTVDGKELKKEVAISRISASLSLDSASAVTFTVEGAYNPKNSSFDSGVKSQLKLGAKVSLKLGYGSSLTEIFQGYIFNVSVDFSDAPSLTITAMDVRRLMMEGTSREVSYPVTTYSAAFEEVMKRYQDLGYKIEVDATDANEIGEGGIVQKTSDYEFIHSNLVKKADREFFVLGDTVYFRKKAKVTKAVTTLRWQEGLLSFSRNSFYQNLKITVLGFDPEKKEPVKAQVTQKATEAQKAMGGQQEVVIVDADSKDEKKAKKRAEKEAAERRQKAQSGSLSCIGLPELVPGRFVGVAGLDPDLDLDYYIREVQHEFGSDGFSTSLTLGGWE